MARASVLSQATQIEPKADDQASAAKFRQAVGTDSTNFTLRLPDGREFELPDALMKILIASAGELSAGHIVTILASETHLTPSEVGTLLGLSRPYVVRLLDAGEIPSINLPGSRHRVVSLTDILAFQAKREHRR